MKVRPVTDAESVRKRILFLIDKCQSFMWATAWATEEKVIQAAIASEKMTCFVIGTHQYITSPDVIDMCLGVSEVKVMYPNGKKMFHPKIYAFDLGGSIEVYVGSSNLTNGGLSRNIECGVFLHSEKTSPSLNKFIDHVENLWGVAEDLDEDFAASYRANHRRMKDAKKELKEFEFIKKPKVLSGSDKSIGPSMDWKTFVSRVSRKQKYGLDKRLKVLSKAREFFARGVPFSELKELERRCIAGVVQPTGQFNADWGLFGQIVSSPVKQTLQK